MAQSSTNADATKAPLPPSGGGLGSICAWDLPLLMKELQELAARPRTYQLRVGYAAALLVISFGVLMANVPRRGTSIVSRLGYGGPVLTSLNLLQELGLYLVIPILACSTLTVEKERQTLDLLLITKLGPWTIIFEKFLSQLIAAVNLLLLSLPLLAFSYSLGGISPEQLLIALLGLLLTAIRLTAIGIFCSAVFRTTVRALLGTYAFILLAGILELALHCLLIPLLIWYQKPQGVLVISPLAETLFMSPGLLTLFRSNLILSSPDIPLLLRITLGSLTSILGSGVFLAFARWFLVPPVRGWSVWLLRRRSESFRKVLPVRQERDAPDDEPITWREGPRGSLTKWWIRNASLATLPVLLLLLGLSWLFRGDEFRFIIGVVYFAIWLAITIRLCSYAATLLIQERTHQTLDLLCCTPLTSTEILRQKMCRLTRTVQISRIPLIVCVAVRTIYFPSFPYVILSAVMIGLYPALIACQALAWGLRAKNGASAILKSLMSIAGWCFLPYLAMVFVSLIALTAGEGAIFIMAIVASFSPLALLGITEIFPFEPSPLGFGSDSIAAAFVMLIISTIITHGLRYLYLSDWPLSHADSVLRGSSRGSSR